jgi:dUTP pyrophosphatase
MSIVSLAGIKVFCGENARLPERAEPGSAGYDLFAAEVRIVEPGQWLLVPTNIKMEIPRGVYGRVAPRSGLAFKNGIDVLAGVIDSSYRGNIGVILMNHGKLPFTVNPGDKIAQLIFELYAVVNEMIPVTSEQDLSDTTRGAGGFGSTGTK